MKRETEMKPAAGSLMGQVWHRPTRLGGPGAAPLLAVPQEVQSWEPQSPEELSACHPSWPSMGHRSVGPKERTSMWSHL